MPEGDSRGAISAPIQWPPDELLETVGMTREEWDAMAAGIERGDAPAARLIADALRKAASRRVVT